MARMARTVIPGLPHHITQRGNGRARTFFSDHDYRSYLDLLAARCRASFLEDPERRTGGALSAAKPGPKPQKNDAQFMQKHSN